MTEPIEQLEVGEIDITNETQAETPDGEIIITMEGQDTNIPMRSLELNIDSTEGQVLSAIRPLMQEQRGLDISDTRGEMSYAVRYARNSNKIYIYPKPVAG